MIDLLSQAIALVSGGVIVVVLMSVMYKRDAVDWEKLVSVYGRDWQTPRFYKQFANMILYSEGRPAKSYKGIISIGLLDDGFALRPNRILVPFQSPVFIPYADVQGWDQGWYIDAKSTELSFRQAPHIRMIMPRKQVEWMLSLAGDAVKISEARPPHGTRPWLTYVHALISAALLVVLVIAVVLNGLPAARQELTREPASLQQGEGPEK